MISSHIPSTVSPNDENAMQPIKSINVFLTVLVLAAVLTACRRENNPSSVAATERVALTQNEIYEREFLRLVVGSNMTVHATQTDVNKLCNDIDKAVDWQDAVRLFDRLGKMALEQPLVSSNYTRRENHLLKLWYVTLNAFVFAQHHRQESFEDWDRLFLFLKRYTGEIETTESALQTTNKIGLVQRTNIENYLHGVRSGLRQNVHVMRRFFFPTIIDGLTEEQKADILRRFDELQKYTAEPPDCHERKVEAK